VHQGFIPDKNEKKEAVGVEIW